MSQETDGVMRRDFAHERSRNPVLQYRYRTRAALAYQALVRLRPFQGWYHVLELGAGEGRALLEIRHLLGGRGQFDGVELSTELVAEAPELPEDTRLLVNDAAQLPDDIAQNHYDLVCALALLEHVPDPEAVVRQAYGRLRGGGVFVATCPHPLWDSVASRLGLVEGDHHVRTLDSAGLVEIAETAGFARVEAFPFMFVGTGILPYLRLPLGPQVGLGIDRVLRKLPGKALRHVFVNQAVVAQKD